MRLTKFFCAAALVVLASCAGTKFDRVSDADLQLSKTTESEIVAKLGKPYEVTNGIHNGQSTRTLVYVYSDPGRESKSPGAAPVKGQAFIFHSDRLVSHQFIANLRDSHTDFDEHKIKQIERGKTTVTQIHQLLGMPSGQAIYPVIKQTDGHGLTYQYAEMHGLTQSTKKARVIVDASGLVVDVEYTTLGNWGK